MPSKDSDSIKLENKILELFKVKENRIQNRFRFNNNLYEIISCAKPSKSTGGEPKTDIYIKALLIQNEITTKESIEIKISAKLEYIKKNSKTGQFMENKMKPGRFWQIFDKSSAESIFDALNNEISELLMQKVNIEYVKDEVRFPLGWRCDIFVNDGRDLSVRVEVLEKEALEIYAGKKRFEENNICIVDGKKMRNSGVANYIIISRAENLRTKDDILKKIIPISSYILEQQHRIFDFALVAINYRSVPALEGTKDNKIEQTGILKYDGKRYLFIPIIWSANKGLLKATIDLGDIYTKTTHDTGPTLIKAFKSLNVDLNNNNNFLRDISKVIPKLHSDLFDFVNQGIIIVKTNPNEKAQTRITNYFKKDNKI